MLANEVHFHLHIHQAPAVDNSAVLTAINQAKEEIMTQVADLLPKFKELADQVDKARTEVLANVDTANAAIAALREQLANAGTLTPEADAELQRLSASIQAIDDITPDPVEEPTPIPGEEPGGTGNDGSNG